MKTRTLHLAAAALVALGCATPAIQTERRPDGVYHLKCQTALPACLAAAENVCDRQRYTVLRAFDDHNLKGDSTQPTDFRSSEALVRCGTDAASWGAETKALREQGPDAAPTAPAPSGSPARACVPGATQTCVGPGGCAGGQACAPDGASFGACDCGARPASPPASP
jgi:hypothetical protein